MKKIAQIFILAGSFCFSHVYSQSVKTDPSSLLEKLYARLVLSTSDSDKLRINDSIVMIIDAFVRSDSIFSYNFTNLRYLGQITSPDSQLKIVNWNLLLKDLQSRYFCYFILKSGKENKVYYLTADYSADPVRTDTTYQEKNWYGALYYDLRPLKKENKGSWMILGIDYGNFSITRKIIDVLTFMPDGGITFGKKWFVAGKEVKFREVLEYSHTAVISLRFISDKSIVFDHLVPIDSSLIGNREFYAPDFSYDAYNFEKGMWRLTLDTDIRNKKE